MGSWETLPHEVLFSIFSYFAKGDPAWSVFDSPLTRKQLQECQLTCKSWSEAAQEHLYHTIAFDTPSQYDNFMQSMKSNTGPNSPAKLVKRIDFGVINYGEWNPAIYITEMAKVCRNLHDFFVLGASSEIWDQLRHVRIEGLWQRVRVLPGIHDESQIMDYAPTVLIYRSTLESLMMRIHQRSAITRDLYMELSSVITERLNEFPHLQRLLLNRYTNKSIYDVESFINPCRQLKEFWFNPIRLDGDNAVGGARRRRGEEEGEITNLSTVPQLPTVKIFYGDKMMLTDNSIRYLMHKFPKLKTLKLNTFPDPGRNTKASQTFDFLDATTMLAFFQYISRVSDFQIYGKFIGQDTVDVIGALLQATRPPKDYKIHISYKDAQEEEPVYYPFMKLSTCKSENAAVTVVPMGNCNKVEVEYLLDPVDFTTWPHTPNIEKYGSQFKELRFKAGLVSVMDRVHEIERAYHTGVYSCLNQILKKCTSLEHLILVDIELCNCPLEKDSINTSTTTLEVRSAVIYLEGFNGLSKKLPALKRLILYDINIQLPIQVQSICKMNINMHESELDNITWTALYYRYKPSKESRFYLHVCEEVNKDEMDTDSAAAGSEEGVYIDQEDVVHKTVDKYYALNRNGEVEKITHDDFCYHARDEYLNFCLEVFCKSLKTITIEYYSIKNQTFILN